MTGPNLKLRVRWNEAEHEGRLLVTAVSGTFTGRGAGWIEPEHLTRFAEELRAFPITPERPPTLTAGGWRDGKLIETGDFVRIVISPLNAIGHLVARISVGEATAGSDRREDPRLSQAAHLAFPAHYQGVSDFAAALDQLAAGAIGEATLQATVP